MSRCFFSFFVFRYANEYYLVEEYEEPEEYDWRRDRRDDVLRRTVLGDLRRIHGSAHSSPRPLSTGGCSSSRQGFVGGIRSTMTSRDGRLCFFSYFS